MSSRLPSCLAGRGRRTARARAAVLVAVLVVASVSAHADEGVVVLAGCKLTTMGTGVIASVHDPRTLGLGDGREVRLSGIEVAPAASEAGLAARRALETTALGQAVALRRLGRDSDRYGRLLAHIFLPTSGSERWLQADLLAAGHARVAGRIGDRACASALLPHERKAREAKLGLWAEPQHAIKRAEDSAAIAAERGRFAIVEGKVLSVRESGGTVYVNFGRRWSEDFTVTILKRNERQFTAAGLEPARLGGRRVRVRGFVEERGGPWIEATYPEQIEVLDRN